MTSTTIEVKNIVKKFGTKIALDAISFKIKEGMIFGFLGPSGSGKTTMIHILTGQLAQEQGIAEIFQKDSRNITADDFEKIGIVSDKSGFYEKLSLEKNLQFYGKLYGVNNEKIDELLQKVGLYESKKIPAEKLSTGMKQRMLLTRALINKPKVLFLDEPTSGLDPTTSQSIHKLLIDLKNQGTSIFLTTHDMSEATLLCDELVLLNKGKLVEAGVPKEIIQKYNTSKKLKLTYSNFEEKELTFSEFEGLDLANVVAVHSCEPTLEDIFIQLTGEKLNV
ncbi:ATP-binding cassette domain-containing protein [Streptococcus sp. zg-86]|uniref:ATP-binding cassette domain-containing protein n=1 Tax=Streptococcus zhangguiae TaxID=2664091 RepID=A0A6I4RFT8_9STRE|nr:MULTISPECIES: ABC transporter ATP-binding protein [unclassified Streptococcus]MTB63726.1 ATP-binding cassette domain-containing protein [Streptococcus sp. zg-86]MTB90036.1 ATP-binding cassette domain-containing protein [Streptococcus sp. zg-36]MWV55707.1 ATP-binding cassette domain-containing protein [Streptococcus sp. zg-70]QTH48002.1 ABC transporter ATP-binding protein [Streptococcus sp. zg-86]